MVPSKASAIAKPRPTLRSVAMRRRSSGFVGTSAAQPVEFVEQHADQHTHE